jgi:hypothetical protein
MRVSSFKVAEHFLRGVSKRLNVPFVDVAIDYAPEATDSSGSFDGQQIRVAGSPDLARTLMSVIGGYLNNLDRIVGKPAGLSETDRSDQLVKAATVVRSFLYSGPNLPETEFDVAEEDNVRVKLSHFPFVWLLMRDVVCPVLREELVDVPVAVVKAASIDAAAHTTFVGRHSEGETPVVLVNDYVRSDPVRSAFVLAAACEALEMDVGKVCSTLLEDAEVRPKVYGMAKLAFVEEQAVSDFLLTLAAISNRPLPDSLVQDRQSPVWNKMAQKQQRYEGFAPVGAGWFMPQLMEQQLDPVRGPDNNTKKRLEALYDEMWRQVAEEKKRLGKADMTLEDLLRVHSRGLRPEPGVLLQGLLAADRIW